MKVWTRHLDVAVQVLLWAMALLSPFLGTLFSGQSLAAAMTVVGYVIPYVLYLMSVFYANYFFFIPSLLFRKRYWVFILGNAGLVCLLRGLLSVVMSWQLGEIPPIPAGIRAVGIRNMEIYRLGTRLFMIVETDDDFDWDASFARLATLDRQAEWEDFVARFQKTEPGSSSAEKWQLMEQIFKLPE